MYAGRYTQNVADLGNDFTAYRILRALIDSGKYD
jgi:hypothetical protein